MMIKGKKKLVAKTLFRFHAFDAAHRLVRHTLVVFNYHRIRPDDPSFVSDFDDDVFGPTVSRFAEQVGWLAERFDILSQEELIRAAGADRLPSRPSVAITFDDGYRDNFTLAYPILRRLHIPAIFFIPSEQIETRRLGWWDLIAYLIKRTAKPHIEFDGQELKPKSDPLETIRFLQNRMSTESEEKTRDLVSRLAAACEVDLPDQQLQSEELMTWEQIREVAQNNVAIGGHTHTHRVLSTLSKEEQREELTRSKREIESRTEYPVRTMAYPVGGYRHFTPQTQRLAEECGYELGFSFNTGVNRWQIKNRFDVKRIFAPNDVPLLAASSVLPEVFSW